MWVSVTAWKSLALEFTINHNAQNYIEKYVVFESGS